VSLPTSIYDPQLNKKILEIVIFGVWSLFAYTDTFIYHASFYSCIVVFASKVKVKVINYGITNE
jgi:hypothetical protein